MPRGFAYSFGSEAEIRLAEHLHDRAPGFERLRFCNSGTEAVMTALKAARAYTGRAKIAKCEGAYHGSYDPAEVSLSSTSDNWGDLRDPARIPYSHGTPAGMLADTVIIPFNEPEAAGAILDRCGGELAAILIDPMPNRVGLMPASQEFLAVLQQAARRHGCLLIFDEVIAFRQGVGGTQGVLGIVPDLTSLGKIIGGGLPVGAVAGRAEVMSVFEERDGNRLLSQGGTFNANPLTMVAGLAAMEMFDGDAVGELNARGDRLREQIAEAFKLANAEGQVTGAGSLFHLHLNSRNLRGYRDALPRGEEAARMAQLQSLMVDAGIYLSPTGLGCLSTAMTEDHLGRFPEALLACLRQLEH